MAKYYLKRRDYLGRVDTHRYGFKPTYGEWRTVFTADSIEAMEAHLRDTKRVGLYSWAVFYRGKAIRRM